MLCPEWLYRKYLDKVWTHSTHVKGPSEMSAEFGGLAGVTKQVDDGEWNYYLRICICI